MSKSKFVKISREKITKNLDICKLFSMSNEDDNVIIHQFNNLDSHKRNEIKQEFSIKEEKMRSDIKKLDDDMCFTCTMINLNIIASRFDVDPSTVCWCLSPPCKINERILVIK